LNRRSEEAAAHALNAVQIAPGAAEILNLASFLLAPLGYPHEALVLSRKSVALNPNYPAVYLGILGNACRLSGQLADAIEAFEAYNARSPASVLLTGDHVSRQWATRQSKGRGKSPSRGAPRFHHRRLEENAVWQRQSAARHGRGGAQ
jgi:tetratricopeptide (TPR) repeat protein